MSPRYQRGIRRILGENSQRVTPQRAVLLELIHGRGGHLDAHELYTLAQKRYPRLSLSTVYRSLRLFKSLGLIHELHFDEEHHHYEERPSREHYHLKCLGCGKIVEFESRRVAQLKKEMGNEHEFEVVGAEIQLAGRCSQCRRQEKGAQ